MDATETVIDEGFSGQSHVIPTGPVNIVCVVTDYGVAACGLVDIAGYDRFGVPAICAKSPAGLIRTAGELLDCPVVKVNSCAQCMGVETGKSARATLIRMRALVRKTRKAG